MQKFLHGTTDNFFVELLLANIPAKLDGIVLLIEGGLSWVTWLQGEHWGP